ncbi:hypothetical protein LUZ60_007422 [Juncus effusus]|nr:hypothetical protein LUZ60_007422 [Juncus effusus]
MVGKNKKQHLSGSILLLPSPMKDFASCFSDQAVRIADVSCSGTASVSTGESISSQLHHHNHHSIQSLTSTYWSSLTTGQELLIRLSWSCSATGTVSSLSVGVDPIPHSDKPSSHVLRKTKGSCTFSISTKTEPNTIVALFWDYSYAKYESGAEPFSQFYVIVVVNSEIALLLGDTCDEVIKKFEGSVKMSEFRLIGRKEQVLGQMVHTTKAKFREFGTEHEITVSCKMKGEEDENEEVFSVSIDKKRVVQIRRLKWNFRGNQTIFVDGAPIDLMWDMHNWWYGKPVPVPSCAVFLFRARSTLESRLWLEEEQSHSNNGKFDPPFSLLIQSFRSRTPTSS